MKREKLLAKLERVIRTIETEKDLPFHIKEIHVFGSTLWKDEPEDLDLILIHERQTEQEFQRVMSALRGYDTFPFQKMNRRLKRSNAERIKIFYGESLEHIVLRYRIGYCRLYWTEAKPSWRGTLEMSVKDLKEVIIEFRKMIDTLTEAVVKYQITLNVMKARGRIHGKELSEIKDLAEKNAKEGVTPGFFEFL